MRFRWLAAFGLVLATASPGAAQSDPVGPFVVDLYGSTAGLPSSAGWTPEVPTGTTVPSRGLGVQGAVHGYVATWGFARLGVGAAIGVARGTAGPPADATSTSSTTTAPTLETQTRLTTLSPQVSFNFGHRLGWSYISLGYGVAKVVSEIAATATVPAGPNDSGWVPAINFGGGARWFLNEHIGAGFDARWHRLGAQAATSTFVGAARASVFSLAAGISIR